MNIEKINCSPVFSGLNLKKVAPEHQSFIKADLDKLKELGEKYDISLKSYINSEYHCDGIEITAKNLRKNLNFLQKFNPPKGSSYFYTTPHYTFDCKNQTFLGRIQEAIENLRTK